MKLSTRIAAVLLLVFALSQVTQAQTIISEIGYDVDFNGVTKWVEFQNTGSTEDDLSTRILCNFPTYQTGGLTAHDGNIVVQPGEFVVIAWDGLGEGDGELGLYLDIEYTSISSILDYIQYGAGDHRRASVAVGAGILSSVDVFVPAAAAGETLQLVDAAGGGKIWISSPSTAGAANVAVNTSAEVDTPQEAFDVDIYPNPFSSHLDIAVPLGSEISVIDIAGRTLIQQKADQGRIRIGGDELPSGFFFVQITSNNKSVMRGVTRL